MNQRTLYAAAIALLAQSFPSFGTWTNEQLARAAERGTQGAYKEQRLIGTLAGALLRERTQAQDAQRALAQMTPPTTSATNELNSHVLATYAQLCTKKHSKTQQEIGCLAAELIRTQEQTKTTQAIITQLHELKSRLDNAEKAIVHLQQSPLNRLSTWFTTKRTLCINHDVYLNLCMPRY